VDSRNVDGNWTVTGSSDANNDGRDDILWASNAGKTAVWYMDGTTFDLVINPA
jgi:hypothetical protein